MKIRPMNDGVLVLRVEEEQKTVGGIIIPDSAKEKPQEGKVVGVGPGKMGDDGKRMPMDVRPETGFFFRNTGVPRSRLTMWSIFL